MEDASALYAAQHFAHRINTAREAVRLYGADHEPITIAALLRSTREGRRSALRGGGEAGLLLGVPSTLVLLDGVPLQKRPSSFAPRVHFWLGTDRIFQGDRLGAWDRAVRIDAATLEAKAALRSIVRRDIKEGYLEGKNSTRNW